MARTPAVGLSSAPVSTASSHAVSLDLTRSIAVTNRLKIQVFWDVGQCVCVCVCIWVQQWTVCPADGGNVARRNDGVHLPEKASLTCRQAGLATRWAVRISNPAGVKNFLSSRTVQTSTGAEVENTWSYASIPPLCLQGCSETILTPLPLPLPLP